MHMIDHHGIASHIAANIITILVRERDGLLPGSSIEERLDFFNNELDAYYGIRGVANRLPPLRYSNLLDDTGYPELHGKLVKAANTRSVIPFLLNLQRRAVDRDPTLTNRHILKVVDSLQSLYNIFYGARDFLTIAEQELVLKHCNRLSKNYQILAVQAVAARQKYWKQPVKLHYVVGHLPWQARLINPRKVQGYCSESMVGLMADIYGKSMYGPHHAKVQNKFAIKYCTALSIEWAMAEP